MSENLADLENDVEMLNSEVPFDNLVILKEFGNIVNLVKDEDFLETVPKAKLRRVKWLPMFNCLKQGIFDEMVQEISNMWEYESMPEKLEILEKQKEKFNDVGDCKKLWRPQLGDVKAQMKASDVQNLQNQKSLLESLAKEYEMRVNRLKNVISAKRGYLKALQLDLQKYQKKNEDFFSKISKKLECHDTFVSDIINNKINVEEESWTDKDLHFDEIK
ncbi:uncharacterized protein LOC101737498 isoform X1 [Bombyx mori]|uniref:Outer kinetochore Nnf1 n=1 Tax=Bombyx mori TaxID=7091 RepID=A0A1W7HDC3_BOMMO|nr:uncharacterized protein LOC101737498 [Bombyx mori]BAX35246.1 outer kinetochore Nnf1 [Bombyx mori]